MYVYAQKRPAPSPDYKSRRFDVWPEPEKSLDEFDIELMWALGVSGKATVSQLGTFLSRKPNTVNKRLKSLVNRRYVVKAANRSLHTKDVYGLGKRGYRTLVTEAGIPPELLTVFSHPEDVGTGYLEHFLMGTDVLASAYSGLQLIGHELESWQREFLLPDKQRIDLFLTTRYADSRFVWFTETDNRPAWKHDHNMVPKYQALWHFWKKPPGGEAPCQAYGIQNFRVLTVARDPKRLPRLIQQAASVYQDDRFGPLMFWFASAADVGTPADFVTPAWRDSLGRSHSIGV